ncbi:hypothetical protein niasHT_030894 [Heterodera trifolii]|uniref:Uncharacterized protein n=1 Tax=Heterodera trifolii TaxID=157864 RepID=A0ABD2HXQ2_9BILA
MSSPSESSGSDGSSTPDVLKVNQGSPIGLTIQQFAEEIETAKGKEIQMMHGIIRSRAYLMPVRLAIPGVPMYDRFSGRGNEKVEDVVYNLAGRTRLSVHGIITAQVTLLGDPVRCDVFYYF